MIMKKTRQFDDIKGGDLIRFLKNPMRGNSPRNNWSFGVVAYRLKNCFRVYPVGKPSYSEGITIRYDGMNMPGKNAVQIAFFLTPEEMNHPDIQGYMQKMEAIKQLKKQLITLQQNLENGATTLFSEYPLPKNNYL